MSLTPIFDQLFSESDQGTQERVAAARLEMLYSENRAEAALDFQEVNAALFDEVDA